MNIKQKITIKLSPDDLKEIIVNYLKASGYDFSVDDVVFKYGRTTQGYGMAEHEVVVFDGAYVAKEN